MSFFSFLRRQPVHGNGRSPTDNKVPTGRAAAQGDARRELIRLALRDILARHGIPASWIDVEMLWLTRPKGAVRQALHVRLLIKHFEPQLLSHGLSLQRSLLRRVSLLDPKAMAWLAGVSWQFAVSDATTCPDWYGPGFRGSAAPSVPAAPAADTSEQAQLAELRRLFAVGDAERARHGGAAATGFEDTRPFELRESARF